MLKYALKNFTQLMQRDKMIMFLAILCVMASVIVMHFAYGLYQNYHVLLVGGKSDITSLNIEILDPEAVTQAALVKCMRDIPDQTAQAISECIAYPQQLTVDTKDANASEQENGSSVYTPVMCFFSVSNGSITSSKYFMNQHINQGTLSGQYFEDEAVAAGAKIALMDRLKFVSGAKTAAQVEFNKNQLQYENPESPMGYDISIQGDLYQVIGSIDHSSFAIVPLTALHSDTKFQFHIKITFGDENDEQSMTRPQYTDVRDTFQKHFGDAVKVPELDLPDIELQYLYKTILLISVLIAAIAAFNFTQLYLYILEKRRRRIAIMRICGCTKMRAAAIFLTECLMLMLPVYLLSFVLFRQIIIPAFDEKFPYMADAFSARIYLALFAIYLGISLIELMFMIVRYLSGTNLAGMQKGAAK